jgi:hypothetical protein
MNLIRYVKTLRKELTAERLREVLDYDASSGVFTYRVYYGYNKPGDRAGGMLPNKHLVIWLDGRFYLSARLAFLYCGGELPENRVVHINGLNYDDRFSNLVTLTPVANPTKLLNQLTKFLPFLR